VPLEVEGLGTLNGRYRLWRRQLRHRRCEALGFAIVPDEASALVATGIKITAAANQQLGFQHPLQAAWEPHLVLSVRRPA